MHQLCEQYRELIEQYQQNRPNIRRSLVGRAIARPGRGRERGMLEPRAQMHNRMREALIEEPQDRLDEPPLQLDQRLGE